MICHDTNHNNNSDFDSSHVLTSGLALNPRRSFLSFRDSVIGISNLTQLAFGIARSPIRAPSQEQKDKYWLGFRSRITQ
jgi:hypothetical protein